MKHLLSFISLGVIFTITVYSQLKVDTYPTEQFMITHMLMGDSTTKIWNVKFHGTHGARGVFYSRNTIIPIEEGLIISSGFAKSASGPNKGPGYTTSNRTKGDLELETLAGMKTYDATWISFEFEATHNLIRFNYIFASEEYPEYVGSTFNDVFAFFLQDLQTGETKNLAVIPNTDLPITVNNINHQKHSNFYLANPTDKKTQIEFDGMTKPLIAFSEVLPGNKYEIRIVVADVGDDAFDSGVFLEGKSFKSEPKETFFEENTEYFEAFTLEEEEIASTVVSDIVKTELASPVQTSKTETTQGIEPKQKVKSEPKNNSKPNSPSTVKKDSIVLYFDFDQSLPIEGEYTKIKSLLAQKNVRSLSVIGHTDQLGSDHYNIELSQNRAVTIKKWIEKNYPQIEVTVEWKSFHQLAQNQNNQKSRAKNRRVVIYISH